MNFIGKGSVLIVDVEIIGHVIIVGDIYIGPSIAIDIKVGVTLMPLFGASAPISVIDAQEPASPQDGRAAIAARPLADCQELTGARAELENNLG